jgi:hypothetical protein
VPPRHDREPQFGPAPATSEAAPPAPDTPPAAAVDDDQRSDPVDEPTRRVLRILPLGAGIALVGLGIGFLGWRLRRS